MFHGPRPRWFIFGSRKTLEAKVVLCTDTISGKLDSQKTEAATQTDKFREEARSQSSVRTEVGDR